MKNKYPIKIIVTKENKFKAATLLEKISNSSISIQQELIFIEIDYTALINTIKTLLAISSQRKVDPRMFWLIGDHIIRFLDRLDEIGFYLMQQNQTLARDIGISESSTKKIICFRRRFSKISWVDPSISWAKYRNNKVNLTKLNT